MGFVFGCCVRNGGLIGCVSVDLLLELLEVWIKGLLPETAYDKECGKEMFEVDYKGQVTSLRTLDMT